MEIKVIFILFSFVLIRSCNFGWCVLNKIRICVKLPICCFSSISYFRLQRQRKSRLFKDCCDKLPEMLSDLA